MFLFGIVFLVFFLIKEVGHDSVWIDQYVYKKKIMIWYESQIDPIWYIKLWMRVNDHTEMIWYILCKWYCYASQVFSNIKQKCSYNNVFKGARKRKILDLDH